MCWPKFFRDRNFRWLKRFLIILAMASLLTGMINNFPKLCNSRQMIDLGLCSFQGYLITFVVLLGSLVAWFVMLFVYIGYIKPFLARRFPMSCGHRKNNFTGKSSKTLKELLLAIDKELPSEEVYQKEQKTVLDFMEDVISTFRDKDIPVSSEPPILAGSVTERYGIPFCDKKTKVADYVNALVTDTDVMLCLDHEEMGTSVSKLERQPHVDPFWGFARLLFKTVNGFEVISSKKIMQQVKQAFPFVKITNLRRDISCFGHCESFGQFVNYNIKGPAINVSMPPMIDCDITLCIKCCEWPPHSDWPTRQRRWPSQEDVNRIVSHGCHLVPRPAPFDKEQTSWRFSFSVAEVELSKLVPNTARKCLLALKIILKDHLRPVLPFTSYVLKMVFLNTLEKTPVREDDNTELDFWVDENIERCFFLLLNEFKDALANENCPHYWFKAINMLQGLKGKYPNQTAALLNKLEMITENPAPFIFDDGCCCLYPCCTRERVYDCRGRPLYDIDEVRICDELVNEQVGERNDAFDASTSNA